MKNSEKDAKVFKIIKSRFEGETGELISMAMEEHLNGAPNYFGRGKYPHWTFLRSMMPVAESIGSLLYNNSSSNNLRLFFENEMSDCRENYKTLTNIIIQLYRHALIHADEAMSIRIEKTFIGWSFKSSAPALHLAVEKYPGKRSSYLVHFSPMGFYEDLIFVLNNLITRAEQNEWNGEVAKRYEAWKIFNLKDPQQIRKRKASSSIYDKVDAEKRELNKLSKGL